jgi:hypothetical protein
VADHSLDAIEVAHVVGSILRENARDGSFGYGPRVITFRT